MEYKSCIIFLTLLFLISPISAQDMTNGLEIIGVGPMPPGGLNAGQKYDFNVVYRCVGPLEDAGLIAVTFTYKDLTTGDLATFPCACTGNEECNCMLSKVIDVGAEEIIFTIEAFSTNAKASTEVIKVNPPGGEPFAGGVCGNLSSGNTALFTHCWEYMEGPYGWDANSFQCNQDVQINPNHPCSVTCAYSLFDQKCKCSLVDACIDSCVDGVVTARCNELKNFACVSSPEYNCLDGAAPEVRCSNTRNCKAECAEGCGRETLCSENGEGCCLHSTCSKQSYNQEEHESCMEACTGMCEANEAMCNIISLLLVVSGFVAVVMLALNGVKWISAENAAARKDARDGVVYTILGVLVGLVALSLVAYLLGTTLTCGF